jgi:hypothetical protein
VGELPSTYLGPFREKTHTILETTPAHLRTYLMVSHHDYPFADASLKQSSHTASSDTTTIATLPLLNTLRVAFCEEKLAYRWDRDIDIEWFLTA